MKKRLFFVALIFAMVYIGFIGLSLDNHVLAEDIPGLNGSLNLSLNLSGAVGGTSGIREGSNNLLGQDVVIPDNLKIVAQVLFGFRESDPVDFSTFIILVALWLLVLMFIFKATSVVPFIKGKATGFIVAVIVTLLIALAGGIRSISVLLVGLGGFFNILEGWAAPWLFVVLLFLGVLFYLASYFFNIFDKQKRIMGMEDSARNIKTASEVGKVYGESLRNV